MEVGEDKLLQLEVLSIPVSLLLMSIIRSILLNMSYLLKSYGLAPGFSSHWRPYSLNFCLFPQRRSAIGREEIF